MTTFSYTTGNPSNLTGGTTASMNDIQGPFTDLRTFLNGANLNSTNLQDGGITAALMDLATQQQLGLNDGAQIGRGVTNISTTETRTNVAYGTMTTPDQVTSVVLPTNGMMVIQFQATWQNSVANAGRAAIFLGANQLQVVGAGPTAVQEATGTTATAADSLLHTGPVGLVSETNTYGGDLTTGQIFGAGPNGGGPTYVFAAAGTYTVSVQYKSSSGSVQVKNRRLLVTTYGP